MQIQTLTMSRLSFDTSKDTVPVRPAKSKGCLGYMASVVTLPASCAPVGLSLVTSRSWPLQMVMSLGGVTVVVPLQVKSCSVAAHPLYWPTPKLKFQVVRETPPPSCMLQFPLIPPGELDAGVVTVRDGIAFWIRTHSGDHAVRYWDVPEIPTHCLCHDLTFPPIYRPRAADLEPLSLFRRHHGAAPRSKSIFATTGG
jgi:hypothetical protein